MGAKLTTKEVSETLNVTPRMLRQWRDDGRGPRFLQYEGFVRYDQDDLLAFIDKYTVDTTDKAGGTE